MPEATQKEKRGAPAAAGLVGVCRRGADSSEVLPCTVRCHSTYDLSPDFREDLVFSRLLEFSVCSFSQSPICKRPYVGNKKVWHSQAIDFSGSQGF